MSVSFRNRYEYSSIFLLAPALYIELVPVKRHKGEPGRHTVL